MKNYLLVTCILMLVISTSLERRRYKRSKSRRGDDIEIAELERILNENKFSKIKSDKKHLFINYGSSFQIFEDEDEKGYTGVIKSQESNVNQAGNKNDIDPELKKYVEKLKNIYSSTNIGKLGFSQLNTIGIYESKYIIFKYPRQKYNFWTIKAKMNKEILQVMQGKKTHQEQKEFQNFCVIIVLKVVDALQNYYDLIKAQKITDAPYFHNNLALSLIQFDENLNVYLPPPILYVREKYLINLRYSGNSELYNVKAPEAFSKENKFDTRADMYSIGMILWQMLGGEHEMSDIHHVSSYRRKIEDKNHVEAGILAFRFMDALQCAKLYNDKYMDIIKAITHLDQSKRPEFGGTKNFLLSMVDHSFKVPQNIYDVNNLLKGYFKFDI